MTPIFLLFFFLRGIFSQCGGLPYASSHYSGDPNSPDLCIMTAKQGGQSFGQAREWCKANYHAASDLPIIYSDNVHNELAYNLGLLSGDWQAIWIGLHDNFSPTDDPDAWFWIDGVSASGTDHYESWCTNPPCDPPQPNDFTENCAFLLRLSAGERRLHDYVCENNDYQFTCMVRVDHLSYTEFSPIEWINTRIRPPGSDPQAYCNFDEFPCPAEYRKCNSLDFQDPSACSNHGTCVFDTSYFAGKCACSLGYEDLDCSRYFCAGRLSTSSTTCHQRGNCTSSNKCTCENGYSGDDCEIIDCSGCNGYGICEMPNICICDTTAFGQYEGPDCVTWRCNGTLHSDISSVCSGNGTCLSPNECDCGDYEGQYCSMWRCAGLLSTHPNICSNHGTCVAPNVCDCGISGYYSVAGNDCNIKECFGQNGIDTRPVCTNHGSCKSPNDCTCDKTANGMYVGERCEMWKCGSFQYNDTENVCSGVGDCIEPGLCSCPGYIGEDCESYMCAGLDSNAADICSNHGKCVSPNNCSCDDGYYHPLGIDCNIVECFGEIGKDGCSDRGECKTPNVCTCDTSLHGIYDGLRCETWKCGTYFHNDTEYVCTGRGVCVEPDLCQCAAGYKGQYCETYSCSGVDQADNDNVCSGHGNCIAPDNCTCQPGYWNDLGVDCNIISCFEDTLRGGCSNRGECTLADKCLCDFTSHGQYEGKHCETFRCGAYLHNDTTRVCSGKGNCVSPGLCQCTVKGYASENCEEIICFGSLESDLQNVCGGHGTCSAIDVCECDDNYDGRECSFRTRRFS